MVGWFSRLFKRGGHVTKTCSRCGSKIPTLGTSLADAIKREGGHVMDSSGRRIDPFQDPDLATKNSAELFAGVELDIFDIGALDVLSAFTVIPSLTESGRVRMDFSTDLEWEIIADLFFRVGFTNNYDSKPSGESSNDYVFSTSVGWSY